MLINSALGTTRTFALPTGASSPTGPQDKVAEWSARKDRHHELQDKLKSIARTYQTKALRFTGLAVLGAVAGVGLAVAGLPMAGLYLGGMAVAGAGIFAAKNFGISREARERHELHQGFAPLVDLFITQFQQERDEAQRAQIASQLERMTSHLSGTGGAVHQAGGVLTVGGARVRQRSS